MAALGGLSMPSDRVNDPAAAYFVPADGWQLFDGVQTAYQSWLGSSTTTGQYGHRMVISTAGRYPVSQYRLRVSSTATNYGSFNIPVGLASDGGSEIAFNQNFVGIDFGANGVLDSHIDQTTHLWVQVGDDKVLMSGKPSTSHYDWWYRFGAQLSATISDYTGFDPLKSEFVASVPTLTAELIVPGGTERIAASRTIKAAQFRAVMSPNGTPGQVRLKIEGGQSLLHSIVETSWGLLPTEWEPISQVLYGQGSELNFTTTGTTTGTMFYRLVTRK